MNMKTRSDGSGGGEESGDEPSTKQNNEHGSSVPTSSTAKEEEPLSLFPCSAMVSATSVVFHLPMGFGII